MCRRTHLHREVMPGERVQIDFKGSAVAGGHALDEREKAGAIVVWQAIGERCSENLLVTFRSDRRQAGIVDREHTSVGADAHQRDRLRLENRSQMQVVAGWHVEGFGNPARGSAHNVPIVTLNGRVYRSLAFDTIRSSVVVETA